MAVSIDPNHWREGFKAGYASRSIPVMSDEVRFSYAAGHFEGDLLRVKHRQEYETYLFSGSRDRLAPNNPSQD